MIGRRRGGGYDRCPLSMLPIILGIPMKINTGRRMRRTANIYLGDVLVLKNHQDYEG